MEPQHRNIIQHYSSYLATKIDINRVKPNLLESKIFTKRMLEDIGSSNALFEELTTRGPLAFEKFIEVLECSGYVDESILLKEGVILKQEKYYNISSNHPGLCLIINNVIFPETHLSEREGSNEDATALHNFFENINYVVQRRDNLSGIKMFQVLKAFSHENFSCVDSCIIFILTHGSNKDNKDVLYGTDAVAVEKRRIIDIFNNTNCKALKGKPKVFFFVACRGSVHDLGEESDDTDAAEMMMDSVLFDKSDDSSSNNNRACVYSDIFIIHSSLPYNVSHRSPVNGTWFCQDLLCVLEQYYNKTDLGSIINLVNQKMMCRLSVLYKSKQAAHIENVGCTKKMRFCF